MCPFLLHWAIMQNTIKKLQHQEAVLVSGNETLSASSCARGRCDGVLMQDMTRGGLQRQYRR